MTQPTYLQLHEIRRDGGTQPRAKIDLAHVKRLVEQIEDGHPLEPLVCFYDGENYWLADGFHRFLAYREAGEEAIAAVVHQGTRRDAVLYAVGANADHKPALPRSREDKRRAVQTLLQDPEWSQWSNYAIADACKVSEAMVRSCRKTLESTLLTTNIRGKERTYERQGKISKMNVEAIGSGVKEGSKVVVDRRHPLAGESGTVDYFPSPQIAIVELRSGKRELVPQANLDPVAMADASWDGGNPIPPESAQDDRPAWEEWGEELFGNFYLYLDKHYRTSI